MHFESENHGTKIESKTKRKQAIEFGFETTGA